MILDQEQALTMRQYSHLFSCLYDQPEPVGRLGRGAHHSVFRTMQWRGIDGQKLEQGRIHDFAVIWDTDHDERVVKVAERLHLAGLLFPVVFIGERKGVMTLLLDYMGGPEVFADEVGWTAKIEAVAEDASDDDGWQVVIGMYQRWEEVDEPTQTNPAGMIGTHPAKAIAYLQGIDALWELGAKSEL